MFEVRGVDSPGSTLTLTLLIVYSFQPWSGCHTTATHCCSGRARGARIRRRGCTRAVLPRNRVAKGASDAACGGLEPTNEPGNNSHPRPLSSARSSVAGDHSKYPTLHKTSVGIQAVEAIRSLIRSGELRPGEALPPERELATSLGISRPSLREAIRALSTMNLVEKRHGGGTFVTSLDPRLLAEPINFLLQVDPMAFEHLFEVRLVLEVAAGADRRHPHDAGPDRPFGPTNGGRPARVLGQPSRYLQYDFDIHTAIVEATDNPIYLSLYHSIADLSIESRKRTARFSGDSPTGARGPRRDCGGVPGEGSWCGR